MNRHDDHHENPLGGFSPKPWEPVADVVSQAGAEAIAVFTVANLLPRAISDHRWYKEIFADYPKERRRLLPFVW